MADIFGNVGSLTELHDVVESSSEVPVTEDKSNKKGLGRRLSSWASKKLFTKKLTKDEMEANLEEADFIRESKKARDREMRERSSVASLMSKKRVNRMELMHSRVTDSPSPTKESSPSLHSVFNDVTTSENGATEDENAALAVDDAAIENASPVSSPTLGTAEMLIYLDKVTSKMTAAFNSGSSSEHLEDSYGITRDAMTDALNSLSAVYMLVKSLSGAEDAIEAPAEDQTTPVVNQPSAEVKVKSRRTSTVTMRRLPHTSDTYKDSIIGSRLQVQDQDGSWAEGIVCRYNHNSKAHEIVFNDGTRSEIDLGSQPVRLED